MSSLARDGFIILRQIISNFISKEVNHTLSESQTPKRRIRQEILETMNRSPRDEKRNESLFEQLIDIEEIIKFQQHLNKLTEDAIQKYF